MNLRIDCDGRKEREMRIFSIFYHPSPSVSAVGGAEKRFIETLKILSKKGVEITVLEPRPGLLARFGIRCETRELGGLFSGSRGSWLSIYVEWFLWVFWACVNCLRILRGQRYDVVLAPNNTLPNLVAAHFVRFVSRLPLCVVVHHVDVLSPFVGPRFFRVYYTYRGVGFDTFASLLKSVALFAVLVFLRHSDVCIAVSNSTAEVLVRNGVPKERVYANGNGVDISYINSFEFEGDKLYDGVFVGRVSKEKGVFDLVKAWRRVVDAKGEARLLIIGSGPDVYGVKNMVEVLGLGKNVVVRGGCSDEDMYTLMKASRVFVFPSVFEGWGLAVAEALACGLPVVCYDIPALREVFGECESVFFVPVKDVERLTCTVLDVLRASEPERLAEVSRRYVKRFDWSRVAMKDLETISLLLH